MAVLGYTSRAGSHLGCRCLSYSHLHFRSSSGQCHARKFQSFTFIFGHASPAPPAPIYVSSLLVTCTKFAICSYKVKLTGEELCFGYSSSLTRETVGTEQIVAAEITHASGLSQWGGWGIRYSRHATGYIASNGPALKITVMKMNPHTTSRQYVFSCDDADALLTMLRDGRCPRLQ